MMLSVANVFAKYEAMQKSGLSPKDVTRVAIEDGFDFAQNLKMLRTVFGLDLVPAKEAWIQAKGLANSLDEYQRSLTPAIEDALTNLPNELES
jgi:hypothetical protein